MSEGKRYLLGMTLVELKEAVQEVGMPAFTAKQIADWVYKKRVHSIEEMTNISIKNRERLQERFAVGQRAPADAARSCDGTIKYLYAVENNHYVEAVYIPDGERATLCVSCQVGCKMNCLFCMTGKQKYTAALTANEILNQIFALPEHDKLTNIVFMGMGEPLDNLDNVLNAIEILTAEWGFGWSPTRITLSTAGVARHLATFLDKTKVHLAVSLHNPFHEERIEIMPIEKAYPIREVCDILRRYDFTGQRRVSFEYIVMEGLNDSPAHIKELCRLLNGIKCRINLIRFHKIPDSPYFSPSDERMRAFRDTLTAKGIQTTIRASRGEDIKAACGLLSTAEKNTINN